jgi:ADP-ribose pyrophosphatase YjhB (NUDIX family)
MVKEQVGVELASLDIGFIESFEGNGAWHIVFHIVGRVEEPSQVVKGMNIAATQWFEVSDLPARSEVAHQGWAIDVVEALEKPHMESVHTRSLVD